MLTFFILFVIALVDTLVVNTRAWEEEHGLSFTYDGVPLLAMLDEYAILRQEREEEKRRMKVCKRAFIFISLLFPEELYNPLHRICIVVNYYVTLILYERLMVCLLRSLILRMQPLWLSTT